MMNDVYYAKTVTEIKGENPNTYTENSESNNASKHHYDLHNPMRRHCQFTVKRSEKRVDLTVVAEPQPCGV